MGVQDNLSIAFRWVNQHIQKHLLQWRRMISVTFIILWCRQVLLIPEYVCTLCLFHKTSESPFFSLFDNSNRFMQWCSSQEAELTVLKKAKGHLTDMVFILPHPPSGKSLLCPNSMLMVIPLEVVTILSNKVEQGVGNYEMTLLSALLLEKRTNYSNGFF